MAVWYNLGRLWSFDILFLFWYVWTKKNLATLVLFKATEQTDGVNFISNVCKQSYSGQIGHCSALSVTVRYQGANYYNK
jgi:hypothetical protein